MMSQPNYDDPFNQRIEGADTPEARHWDKLWIALEEAQGPWEQRPPGRAHFIQSMRRISSVISQDKRFWKLSAKHAIRNLLGPIDEDGLLHLEDDKDFEETFPNKQGSITYFIGMDWQFFSRLILDSLLSPLEMLDDEAVDDLSRFDALKVQVNKVRGVVTYAHFIDRLDDLIWNEELIERITVQRFVDAIIAAAEGRAREILPPDPDPDWRPIETEIRSAIEDGNASVSPPSEFD